MGKEFYPSYRIRDAWASFDLPKNPTFVNWFFRVNEACDPNVNKSQEVFYRCVADTAKRDLGVSENAESGCYYDQPTLANFCYWMAAFDDYVEERALEL